MQAYIRRRCDVQIQFLWSFPKWLIIKINVYILSIYLLLRMQMVGPFHFGTFPIFLQFPGCTEENLVRIAGLLTEIQTGNLPVLTTEEWHFMWELYTVLLKGHMSVCSSSCSLRCSMKTAMLCSLLQPSINIHKAKTECRVMCNGQTVRC
jgi:hypothetical protein